MSRIPTYQEQARRVTLAGELALPRNPNELPPPSMHNLEPGWHTEEFLLLRRITPPEWATKDLLRDRWYFSQPFKYPEWCAP